MKGLNIKWHSEDTKYALVVFLEKLGVQQKDIDGNKPAR
jgi:hypothetical protein